MDCQAFELYSLWTMRPLKSKLSVNMGKAKRVCVNEENQESTWQGTTIGIQIGIFYSQENSIFYALVVLYDIVKYMQAKQAPIFQTRKIRVQI